MEKVKLVRDQPHQKYFLQDGTQVAGGSTISKIGEDAGGLIYWAWDLGKKGKDYRKVSQEACDVGTLAHFMIEAFLNGFVCDLDDYSTADIEKAIVCYTKFVDWWDQQNLIKQVTEIQLVHHELRYGGTIDLIAWSKALNGFVLIDFKTSKKISEPYWRQCAGYAQLWNFHEDRVASPQQPARHIKSHAIVRIGKQEEGDFEVVWKDDLSNYWNTFQQQVKVWWALKEEKPKKIKKTK
jgi:hypothetical protein